MSSAAKKVPASMIIIAFWNGILAPLDRYIPKVRSLIKVHLLELPNVVPSVPRMDCPQGLESLQLVRDTVELNVIKIMLPFSFHVPSIITGAGRYFGEGTSPVVEVPEPPELPVVVVEVMDG